MNRRNFLMRSGIAAAGVWAGRSALAVPGDRPVGPNEEIRTAVIGFNAHGKSHIRAYKSMPGVRLVALCDVDEQVLQGQAGELAKENLQVKTYRDLRELLDNKEIDAVSVATPNHWHALATVWACQAGKDVCVEKPISHCIWEGRKMVEAARKYNRMVQADLDSRGNAGLQLASDYMKSGQLGKMLYCRAFVYKRRQSMGKTLGPQKVPDSVDYNLWTGPAPMRPLMRGKFHYDWHWQWATGNGEIANVGSHHMDQLRWVMGKDKLPEAVFSFGGRYGYIDDGQTPNTQVAVYTYDGVPVVFEGRGLPEKAGNDKMNDFTVETATGKSVNYPHPGRGENEGFAIVCEGGYCYRGTVYDNDGKEMKTFERQRGQGAQANFISGVRSRKIEDLKTDISQGHTSAAFSHMGNVSYQCGEPLPLDTARKAIAVNPQAEKALDRMLDHLQQNGVNMADHPIIVGPKLTMDPDREQFTGDHSARANLFVRDTYREPFVIRDSV